MIVSNRKSLAKRVQRVLRVKDLRIPVADATRDLGPMQQVGPGDDAVRESRDSEWQGGEVAGLRCWPGRTAKQSSFTPRAFGRPSPLGWSSMACRLQI